MLEEAHKAILRLLYEFWWKYGRRSAMMLEDIAQFAELNRVDLHLQIDILNEKSLTDYATNETVSITSQGILYAEQNGLATEQQKGQSDQERIHILNVLTKVREEHGVYDYSNWQHIVQEAGIEQIAFDRQYQLL